MDGLNSSYRFLSSIGHDVEDYEAGVLVPSGLGKSRWNGNFAFFHEAHARMPIAFFSLMLPLRAVRRNLDKGWTMH
jgi:hypothetical protein